MMPTVLNFLRLTRVDLRDAIEPRQWGYPQKLADAEVTTHRGDGSGLCASCLEPRYQRDKNFRLLSRILIRKVLGEITHLGVRDGQLQTRPGLRMPIGQASVVELGRGRSDTPDQPDVHLASTIGG